jgi:signal transduction histidine kinase
VGLAWAKRIIELHGGEIWLDSRPGDGSDFYFSIDLAPELNQQDSV